MARYQIILAYNGAAYQGYQRQRNAPTIQGAVESALTRLGWQGKTILAAGRTDSGVHAQGQVVAFDLEWAHSEDALQAALNANLPEDIAVRAVKIAAANFHPRYSAELRRYRYQVYCARERHPLLEPKAWRIWPAPAIDSLKAAAGMCVGKHDFAAFGTAPRAGGTTIRNVQSAGWCEYSEPLSEEPLLVFEISANAFLYHMVRRLTYLLVSIGQGCFPVNTLSDLLAAPPAQPVQGLAPAHGLALVEVVFSSEKREYKLEE